MWDRLEGREIRRRLASSTRIAARRGISAPEAVDLAAEPAFAQPPKLPEPAVRWRSWGRQPRRRRLRDLKWRSVRRTEHTTARTR